MPATTAKTHEDARDQSATHDPSVDAGDDGILHIGIDLGTSRTAIAASNGVRESTFSLVGSMSQFRKAHTATLLSNGKVEIGRAHV